MPTSCLPPELWLQVFHWATNYSQNTFSTTYEPFSNSPFVEEHQVLRVKHSLALVCRTWHALSKEFLYRDVRIGPAQTSLKEALCTPEESAKFVRRVVLPFQSTTTPTYSSSPLTSVEILKLCPQVEVLVRPRLLAPSTLQTPRDAPRFEFDVDSLSLPSLKRLEWNFLPEAERTGGINSLTDVLLHSPNIEYLHIGGFNPRSQIPPGHSQIHLPKLNTISMSSLTAHVIHQLCYRWTLPALSHLIVGSVNLPTISTLWERYASQLESVELGRHLAFLQRDFVGPCVRSCPNLKELNYHVFFTLPPDFAGESGSIETIGLHAGRNEMLPPESDAAWALLLSHLDSLLGGALPLLRDIRLHGDWSVFLADGRITSRLYGGGYNIYVCS
ncbi:hypothetical protein V5O48_001211 [Marasmius crinis-equi]|uniref:F-box domain-containing protein n=1 Tax=Marasmius crinis-equi TaxID=585013 RepID=A0ABR3G0D0_9AGAR